jgi:drug/metabolite transporter (DMT)-like permease
MGAKEKIQKELDLLLEKIRFWRYVIFGIVSGVVGVLFGLTQNKIHITWGVIFLLGAGLAGIIVSIKRLSDLTKDYQQNLELLEREE